MGLRRALQVKKEAKVKKYLVRTFEYIKQVGRNRTLEIALKPSKPKMQIKHLI
jgi:hypothetical protein